jgi:hypothetical protein
MPAKVGECLSLSLPYSASISPSCCIPRCLHLSNSADRSLYRRGSVSRVDSRTRAPQRHVRAVSCRDRAVQIPSHAQTAFTRHSTSAAVRQRSTFKFLSNFLKFFGFVCISERLQRFFIFRKI